MSPDQDSRLHFDHVASLYGTARPDYPPALFEQLQAWGVPCKGSRVLELGPGGGQATRGLLARGVARLDALELGSALAEALRADHPDPRLHVQIGDAHTLPLPARAYDLCVAATSFHWLDPAIMVPRLAGAIRPGGWLAVWWTEFGDPTVETPFRIELDRLTRRWGNHISEPPRSLQVADRVEELTQGDLFGHSHHALFRWTVEMTSAQIHALFSTFSTFAGRPGELAQLKQLVDDLGGTITEHYITALYAVQRTTSVKDSL